MFYGDTVGLQTVVDAMKRFQSEMGDDFKVSPLLERLAREGKTFQALKPEDIQQRTPEAA
jgi:3-hydroxyacyl-CoA dehydrogenase